jgi:hypothetical protein
MFNKAPCPKHDDYYVKDKLGNYIGQDFSCMRCKKDIHDAFHNFQCYTDLDAKRLIRNLQHLSYDAPVDEHVAYHFANGIANIINIRDLDANDIKPIYDKAQQELTYCHPGYNPWNDIFENPSKHGSQDKQCGKTYLESMNIWEDLEGLEHPCCNKQWRCNLPKGHDSDEHSDESHLAKNKCPNGANIDLFDNCSYSWKDMANPYDEIFGNIKKGSTEPTQEEIWDADSKGIGLYDYKYARRSGATHQEVVDAGKHGINAFRYGVAREHGVTHPEILDANKNGLYLLEYVDARNSGATHNEIFDAHKRGMHTDYYACAREVGATHDEAIDAFNHGIYMGDYTNARHYKATHDQIIEAHDNGIDLSDYVTSREFGSTHDEIKEAHNIGMPIVYYTHAIANGANHEETLDSYKQLAGQRNLQDYGYLRGEGIDHTSAINSIKPDYNPYDEIFDINKNKLGG